MDKCLHLVSPVVCYDNLHRLGLLDLSANQVSPSILGGGRREGGREGGERKRREWEGGRECGREEGREGGGEREREKIFNSCYIYIVTAASKGANFADCNP